MCGIVAVVGRPGAHAAPSATELLEGLDDAAAMLAASGQPADVLDRAVARLAGVDRALQGVAGVLALAGHADLDAALSSPALAGSRVFAFTAHATRWHSDVEFEPGDVLLFGPEPTGLPAEVLAHERVTDRLRIPMVPGRRSLNLSNSAAVATYEAWRQQGFTGAE